MTGIAFKIKSSFKQMNIKRAAKIMGLLAILCIAIWLVVFLVRLWSASAAVISDLKTLQSLADSGLESIQPDEMATLVHTMDRDAARLAKAASPLIRLAPLFGWLPYYGNDIQTAPILVDIALNLSHAADVLVEPLAPLFPMASNHAGLERSTILTDGLPVLKAAQSELLIAHSYVMSAQKTWRAIEIQKLSPTSRPYAERIDRYLPVLELGLKGALLAPHVVDDDAPSTFLILIQNEDELRATGGFISAVAAITFQGMDILDVKIQDSYSVDDFTKPYPEPPLPLQQYMLAELWLFRDSNWSPDFPTSAQKAIDLYSISHEEEINGVISIDQQAIRLLIKALGPIQIPGVSEPVTAENLVEFSRSSWSPENGTTEGDWWSHRKDFMSDVLVAAIDTLEDGLNKDRLIDISKATWTAFQTKDLQFYLKDSKGAALVSNFGWDGAQRQIDKDYLSVINTNVGFNKTNVVIKESYTYTVDLRNPFAPEATLKITHRHTLDDPNIVCRHEPRYEGDYEEMIKRCYWDYLRVYIPAGSALLDATPHDVPGQFLLSGIDNPATAKVEKGDNGHDCFATLFLLKPGESIETHFRYSLPNKILEIEDKITSYQLLIQKQSGTENIPVEIHIMLPPKSRLISTEPSTYIENDHELIFNLSLDMDQKVNLSYHAPSK